MADKLLGKCVSSRGKYCKVQVTFHYFSAATYMPTCLVILNRLLGHNRESSQMDVKPCALLEQQL